MTGAVLALVTVSPVRAQSSADDDAAIPRNRPSLESYSLPPGPDSSPKTSNVQGPVDAEAPLVQPPAVAPRSAPAAAPPVPRNPAETAAPVDTGTVSASQRVRQSPDRSAIAETDTPQEAPVLTDPANRNYGVHTGVSTTVGDEKAVDAPPPPAVVAEPVLSDSEDGRVAWILAALLFGLLAVALLWRWRRSATKQPAASAAERPGGGPPSTAATPPLPPKSVSAIGLAFQPITANTTLINAVLGFELTLTNQGIDGLNTIRVSGAMGQAANVETANAAASDLLALAEIQALPAGKSETIISEFRIPLNNIQAIHFRSQALFVPCVHVAIEFTDDAGMQHLHTAAFLVGLEHCPPRPKMAPIRLDLGPRSFTPLGHRPLASG